MLFDELLWKLSALLHRKPICILEYHLVRGFACDATDRLPRFRTSAFISCDLFSTRHAAVVRTDRGTRHRFATCVNLVRIIPLHAVTWSLERPLHEAVRREVPSSNPLRRDRATTGLCARLCIPKGVVPRKMA